MANPEHVLVVRQGADAVAGWRERNPGGKLDLSDADLSATDLSGADLSAMDLGAANLRGADLRRANLNLAYLTRANLGGANLSEANLLEADLTFADLTDANITGADLSNALLWFASGLTSAQLRSTLSHEGAMLSPGFSVGPTGSGGPSGMNPPMPARHGFDTSDEDAQLRSNFDQTIDTIDSLVKDILQDYIEANKLSTVGAKLKAYRAVHAGAYQAQWHIKTDDHMILGITMRQPDEPKEAPHFSDIMVFIPRGLSSSLTAAATRKGLHEGEILCNALHSKTGLECDPPEIGRY